MTDLHSPDPADRADDVAVLEHHGMVMLQGSQNAVQRFIESESALVTAKPIAVSTSTVVGALAELAETLGTPGTHQQLFQLDAVGTKMFEAGSLASAKGGDGLRLFSRGADGLISGHGAIKPLLMAPQQVLTAQMALTTIALTAAIKDVQAAVERVEDKVDLFRDLIDSQRVGEILGSNRALARRAEKVGYGGQISETDWQAIDGTGVEVEQQIEALRSFIRKRLRSAETKGMQISGRRAAIDDAKELSDALALLVVAQDSLFTYQELRIQRIRATEAHQLESALEEANELIQQHRSEDEDLLGRVSRVVGERASVRALEIHRFITARKLVRTVDEVDDMLSEFATNRSLFYEALPDPEIPGIGDAVAEVRSRGGEVVGTSRRAAGRFAHRVGDRLAKGDDVESPADPPGPPNSK